MAANPDSLPPSWELGGEVKGASASRVLVLGLAFCTRADIFTWSPLSPFLPPSFLPSLSSCLSTQWSASATPGYSSQTCASGTRCSRVSGTWARWAAASLCASAPWQRDKTGERKLDTEEVDVWDAAQTGWANKENEKGREVKQASAWGRGTSLCDEI